MRNMAFKQSGKMLISYYNDRPPTEEDHAASVSAIKALDLGAVRFLTFTKGGAPSAAQRKDLNELLAGREVLTAIVSDAIMMRGVVTALSWFNRNVKVYSMDDAEEAFRYLGVPPNLHQHVWDDIRRLETELVGFRKDQRVAAGRGR